MTEYDIVTAFQKIENELIASMIRNMERHQAEETAEGYEWSMWQAEQLKTLEKYKKQNQKKYEKQFKNINAQIEVLIEQARETGNADQEIEILEAIKDGFNGIKRPSKGAVAEFFKLNDRKLEELIKATVSDMEKAETAILRKAEDDYRKAIFNAQVYANTGAGTYEKAVDMATKDMLSRGLACVEYANGARHTLKDYADMALRTASKRAYLSGEGEKRQEWGIATVVVNKRGNPCPKCLPFVGKVLIDDVWSGGSKEDGDYPLMSHAVSMGLYHPRCKDSHSTYFPGISTADDTWTREELEAIGLASHQEARQQYAMRQADKYDRLVTYSLDPTNKKQYRIRAAEWKGKRFAVSESIIEHRKDTPKRMIDLVERYSADEFVELDSSADGAFMYDPDKDAVIVNPTHPSYQYHNYKEIMIHELAHRIDQNEFGSPMNTEFSNSIIAAEKRITKNAEHYRKLFEPGGKFKYNNLISDIVGCITDNLVVGGASHESQYIGIPGYVELEVFADIFSALYQGDDDTVEFIQNELSDVYEAFLQIIG